MTIEEAIAILKTHNEWRRGADIPMTDPKILGEAIDTVVEHFDDAFIPVAESYERGFVQGKEVGEREALTWHKVADGDLPEDGQHILIAHKMRNGDYMIEAIWYPEPPITDDIDYWMEIPEINTNSEKVNATYDAEYLQSKINAHTKRMEEQGLTSEQMLEECRGGDLLTWQDIRKIVTIADDMVDKRAYIKGTEPWLNSPEAYYTEVLKRFKED